MKTNELIKQLQDRVELLERVVGVTGEWITPPQAAKIWPVSEDRIKQEIRNAEQRRITRKPCDLVYGVHYYSTLFPVDFVPGKGFVINDNKSRNTWHVNATKFWEVVSLPVEKRNF